MEGEEGSGGVVMSLPRTDILNWLMNQVHNKKQPRYLTSILSF